MFNEADTAELLICEPQRKSDATDVLLLLLRLLRLCSRPVCVPRRTKCTLPNGCALAVRYTSR